MVPVSGCPPGPLDHPRAPPRTGTPAPLLGTRLKWGRAPALAALRIRTFHVGAGEPRLDPARDEARHRCDIRDRVTPRSQPDHLNLPHGRGIACPPEFSIKSCFVIISQQTLFLATKPRQSYENKNS